MASKLPTGTCNLGKVHRACPKRRKFQFEMQLSFVGILAGATHVELRSCLGIGNAWSTGSNIRSQCCIPGDVRHLMGEEGPAGVGRSQAAAECPRGQASADYRHHTSALWLHIPDYALTVVSPTACNERRRACMCPLAEHNTRVANAVSSSGCAAFANES